MKLYDAKPGESWLCGACGKTARNRATGGESPGWDESCFLHAILVETTSIRRNETGRIVEARAVGKG